MGSKRVAAGVLVVALVVGVVAFYSSQGLPTRTITVSSTVQRTITVVSQVGTVTVSSNFTSIATANSVVLTNGSQPVLCSSTFVYFDDIVTSTFSVTTITQENSTSTETFPIESGGNTWVTSSWTYVSATNSTSSVGYVTSTTISYTNNLLSIPTLVTTCTYLP